MHTKILILSLIALAGCQEATSSTPQAGPTTPQMVTRKAATMLPNGSCAARLVHDSWVSAYVDTSMVCFVPADSIRPHADGSTHATKYAPVTAYMTWETNDGNCEPRAWAISNVVSHAACLKNPPRHLYDTAGRMAPVQTWGMDSLAGGN